jgi:hypothetical protein
MKCTDASTYNGIRQAMRNINEWIRLADMAAELGREHERKACLQDAALLADILRKMLEDATDAMPEQKQATQVGGGR